MAINPWAITFVLIAGFLAIVSLVPESGRGQAVAVAIFLLLIIVGAFVDRSRARAAVTAAPDREVELAPWRDDLSVLNEPAAFGYTVFTRAHDEVVRPEALASVSQLVRWRSMLDARLVDASLSGVPPYISVSEGTAVTLLLDNSGSLRRPPGDDSVSGTYVPPGDAQIDSKAMLLACITDALVTRLEQSGVMVEVLGFTTVRWKGGLSREQWNAAGRQAYPGRLNDLRHIIYKEFSEPFEAVSRNFALMLDERILKENFDGEAIAWAHSRLVSRPEPKKVLVVISDGAPVDDSTLNQNGGAFLERHLRHVVRDVEARGPVRLVAIGIGHDVSRYYASAINTGGATLPSESLISELLNHIATTVR